MGTTGLEPPQSSIALWEPPTPDREKQKLFLLFFSKDKAGPPGPDPPGSSILHLTSFSFIVCLFFFTLVNNNYLGRGEQHHGGFLEYRARHTHLSSVLLTLQVLQTEPNSLTIYVCTDNVKTNIKYKVNASYCVIRFEDRLQIPV